MPRDVGKEMAEKVEVYASRLASGETSATEDQRAKAHRALLRMVKENPNAGIEADEEHLNRYLGLRAMGITRPNVDMLKSAKSQITSTNTLEHTFFSLNTTYRPSLDEEIDVDMLFDPRSLESWPAGINYDDVWVIDPAVGRQAVGKGLFRATWALCVWGTFTGRGGRPDVIRMCCCISPGFRACTGSETRARICRKGAPRRDAFPPVQSGAFLHPEVRGAIPSSLLPKNSANTTPGDAHPRPAGVRFWRHAHI